jgi:hypothetical protein
MGNPKMLPTAGIKGIEIIVPIHMAASNVSAECATLPADFKY